MLKYFQHSSAFETVCSQNLIFLEIVFHWSIPSRSSFKDGFPLKPKEITLIIQKSLLNKDFTHDLHCTLVISFSFKSQAFYNQGRSERPSVRDGQLFSLIQICQSCPINFKLCMVIPIKVQVRFRNRSNSISFTRKSVLPFQTNLG